MPKILFLRFAIILFAVLLCALSGCKPNYTDVKLHRVDCCDVTSESKGKMTIGFGLDVENPNRFPITIRDMDVSVKLNGIPVGSAGGNKKVKLLKQTRKMYKMQVEADASKVLVGSLANLGALLSGKKKSMEATIEGEIKASAMGISRTIPVSGSYPIEF